ncbi:hypothetical protein N2603_38430 [Bradyrhizobium huanghuaihaiense]|uniref:hypothetical protein n=1 Tax=Bradyrhizobium huanghuaihaiense TaxID=990078 RepID=UPI0021A9AA9D|nr:hypothetical protein [Bradyrhizobium sp. CB3035]UWU75785.1 hypothetical protein N2603_38430 [Bradyrhizobium sp. CB3035]
MEYCRNLAIHLVFSVQLDDPLPQSIDVDLIAVGLNAPLNVMLAGCAGIPDDLEPHLTSGLLLVKNDFTNDKSQNALAIGYRGGGCIPNPRQVLAERS